jgi:WD40 repeat protein
MVARHRIANAGSLRSLAFAVTGRRTRLVTNSSDRTLRLFTLPATYPSPSPSTATDSEGVFILEQDLEPSHRFSDPISRTAWASVSVDGAGCVLAAGAADSAAHKIYLWDLANDGRLLTTLDGGREPLVDAHVRGTFFFLCRGCVGRKGSASFSFASGTLINRGSCLRHGMVTSLCGIPLHLNDGVHSLVGSRRWTRMCGTRKERMNLTWCVVFRYPVVLLVSDLIFL